MYDSYLPISLQTFTIFSLKQLQDLVGDFPSQELLQVYNYGNQEQLNKQ